MPTYTIFIHVPVYTDGPRCFVISEWKRAMELLQGSLGATFDRILLVAPSRPAEGAGGLLEPIGAEDGIEPRPSIPAATSKRGYWLGGGRWRWRRDVGRALDETDMAHTVIDNLYRPLSLDANRMVRARGCPHVFFLDTDIVVQNSELIQAGLRRGGPVQRLHDRAYEATLRNIVAAADVAFLKGQALVDRYGPYAKNPKLFHDTSYHSDEVVGAGVVEARLEGRGGALRLVYCGRLVARKGCDRAIGIVTDAREKGANVTLDLIGDGPERAALEAQARGLEAVRFLGERPYGPELIRELAAYDALLFTPLAEDTPRMIFDGYAAGLPLVGHDIGYVRERAAEEGATVLLPLGDTGAAGDIVAALARDPDRIATLARAALSAGQDNATDVWYRRRAEWTQEAFARRS